MNLGTNRPLIGLVSYLIVRLQYFIVRTKSTWFQQQKNTSWPPDGQLLGTQDDSHEVIGSADHPSPAVSDGPDCPACDEAIKQLEQIDDDTDAVGVKFVKTDDAEFAAEFGIAEFPAILYFEDKEPSIYDGREEQQKILLGNIHF